MPAANTEIVERRAAKAKPSSEHVCSDACSLDGDMCPRARAIIETAMSDEAAALIDAAFHVWWLSVSGKNDGIDPHLDEVLQLTQVHYSHALRRFKSAHSEFCGWGQRSENLVIDWTIRLAAGGHPIPAAEEAARAVGMRWEKAVAACKARMV